MYRQGDILLVPVTGLPEDATPVAATAGRIVLAEGEATGHAHAIRETDVVEMLRADGLTFLRAIGDFAVRHEEHEAVKLPAGLYQVIRQREYSPQEIYTVAD